MHTIEIDNDIYSLLQQKAEPFIDSPNTVLRKLLLNMSSSEITTSKRVVNKTSPAFVREVDTLSTEAYIRRVWKEKFNATPRQVKTFRMMYESTTDVVYFQNFNKNGAEN